MDARPLVSICCITYNHELFIRQCLDGFMAQQTDFLFEILIHDDASTDRTQDIIKQYQERYPETIKAILQTENQYSKGVRGINIHFNFPRALGKYIAICEGDDYWTDSYKLKKQVDFLEDNPTYSLTCGGYIQRNASTGKETIEIIDSDRLFPKQRSGGFEFSLVDLHKTWLTKTLTVVFRKAFLDTEKLLGFSYCRDTHVFHQLIKRGDGFYFKEVLGVYNVHEGGMYSLSSKQAKIDTAYRLYKEMNEVEKDVYTQKKLFESGLKKLHFDKHHRSPKTSFRQRVQLAFETASKGSGIKDTLRVTLMFFGVK